MENCSYWYYELEVNGVNYKDIIESETYAFPMLKVFNIIASMPNVSSYSFKICIEMGQGDFNKLRESLFKEEGVIR
jgi:hypothetical protein